MGESLQWLKVHVDEVSYDEKLFRISVSEDKYLFGALSKSQNDKPDYFAISSIYNTIVDLNHKIKFSFYMAAECEPSESLVDHICFGTPQINERTAIYFIENMVFRTAILWDMLAQLCNIYWMINKPTDKIYAAQFFHDLAQGRKASEDARQIYAYFTEPDNIRGDLEFWGGNHGYIKEYRDKMTHRNSPNISTLSTFDIGLRPPAIYVLKRATEDFLEANKFIKKILDDIVHNIDSLELFPNAKENNYV